MNDERTFRLSEARAMLPRVDALLTAVQAAQREAADTQALILALRRAASGDGSSLQTDSGGLETKLRDLANSMREAVQEITEMGVQIKDLERGLVDWVGLREERKVYICWERGEPEIAFWHELDTGFAGRQPIEPGEWD